MIRRENERLSDRTRTLCAASQRVFRVGVYREGGGLKPSEFIGREVETERLSDRTRRGHVREGRIARQF